MVGVQFRPIQQIKSVAFGNMMQSLKGKPSSSGSLGTASNESSSHDTIITLSQAAFPQASLDWADEYDEAIAELTGSSNRSSATASDILPVERKEQLQASIDSSSIVDTVERDDLRVINLIGKGSFCKVHLASGPALLLSKKSSRRTIEADDRGPRALFAVKSIDTSKMKCSSELILAAGELVNEATILSELDHQNVVRLRGVCSETFSGSFGHGGFFLVFDILQETLDVRLRTWRHQRYMKERLYRKAKKALKKSSLPQILWKPKKQCDTQSIELRPDFDEKKRRLYFRIQETVLGIVKGMEYLHSKGIVLRDLKPANIGYMDNTSVKYGTSTIDTSNHGERSGSTVRLFDFGMAAKVEDCNPHEICGSLRYMAPEVMTGDGYSLKVDVYSFGVILFEMCSLCHPFTQTWVKRQKQMIRRLLSKNLKRMVEEYREQVVSGELKMARNLQESVFCPELRSLIEECCAPDPSMRPDFAQIRSRLESNYTRIKEMR